MRRPGWISVVGVVLGVTGLLAAGCSSGSESGAGTASGTTAGATTAAATGGGDEVKLTAENTSWSTTSLRFASGAKVTVEVANNDSIEHNFTFREATVARDVEGGEDVTLSFTAPASGTYKFFCKYHPSAMTGTVTVT